MVNKTCKIKGCSKNNINNSNGFTLMECVIAICLVVIVLGGLVGLVVTTIRNGKFVEKLVDSNTLLSAKTNQLLNSTATEVSKLPKGQKRAGSIDPSQPVAGYFDVLNQSGCVIKRSSPTFSTIDTEIETGKGIKSSGTGGPIGGSGVTTKAKATGSTGKLGDIGGDIGDLGDSSPLDCSTSTFTNPNQALEPKFRRQWVVVKDFPATGDVSFSIVVVAIQTNQITLGTTITKSDGTVIK